MRLRLAETFHHHRCLLDRHRRVIDNNRRRPKINCKFRWSRQSMHNRKMEICGCGLNRWLIYSRFNNNKTLQRFSKFTSIVLLCFSSKEVGAGMKRSQKSTKVDAFNPTIDQLSCESYKLAQLASKIANMITALRPVAYLNSISA